jgi:hypothetical protein
MLTLSSSGQLNALPPTVDDQTIRFGINQISVEQLYQGKERTPCNLSGGYLLIFQVVIYWSLAALARDQ